MPISDDGRNPLHELEVLSGQLESLQGLVTVLLGAVHQSLEPESARTLQQHLQALAEHYGDEPEGFAFHHAAQAMSAASTVGSRPRLVWRWMSDQGA